MEFFGIVVKKKRKRGNPGIAALSAAGVAAKKAKNLVTDQVDAFGTMMKFGNTMLDTQAKMMERQALMGQPEKDSFDELLPYVMEWLKNNNNAPPGGTTTVENPPADLQQQKLPKGVSIETAEGSISISEEFLKEVIGEVDLTIPQKLKLRAVLKKKGIQL